MQYQMNEFLFSMILTELEDAVGKENCSTRAIDKGMPIEQVQRLLGHAKIDTTMQLPDARGGHHRLPEGRDRGLEGAQNRQLL